MSESGSCSGGGEKRIKTDGWYIDLPVARTAYSAVAFAKCNDVTDHIEFHQTGPRRTDSRCSKLVPHPIRAA